MQRHASWLGSVIGQAPCTKLSFVKRCIVSHIILPQDHIDLLDSPARLKNTWIALPKCMPALQPFLPKLNMSLQDIYGCDLHFYFLLALSEEVFSLLISAVLVGRHLPQPGHQLCKSIRDYISDRLWGAVACLPDQLGHEHTHDR